MRSNQCRVVTRSDGGRCCGETCTRNTWAPLGERKCLFKHTSPVSMCSRFQVQREEGENGIRRGPFELIQQNIVPVHSGPGRCCMTWKSPWTSDQGHLSSRWFAWRFIAGTHLKTKQPARSDNSHAQGRNANSRQKGPTCLCFINELRRRRSYCLPLSALPQTSK